MALHAKRVHIDIIQLAHDPCGIFIVERYINSIPFGMLAILMQKEFDLIGLGNVLMDVLVRVEDSELERFNFKKGVFHLADENLAEELVKKIEGKNPKLMPAGSCPNTVIGAAKLGGKCSLIGKIGSDRYGEIYLDDLQKHNVHSNLVLSEKSSTGKAICLITPDAQRTFVVNLGAAMTLQKTDIAEGDIKKSKILHLTGYELEDARLRESSIHAMKVARENGTKVSIDLADPELIKRCKADLQKIVKGYADFVFANQEEAAAFTGKENPFDSLEELNKFSEISIVKVGEKGSLIKNAWKTINIDIFPTKVVDTTGAGDLFAAGFLWGFTQNKPLESCGKIGSFMASKVISQMGARIEGPLEEVTNML